MNKLIEDDGWLCEKCFSDLGRSIDVSLPIKTIPNHFHHLCIICNEKADYLVTCLLDHIDVINTLRFKRKDK